MKNTLLATLFVASVLTPVASVAFAQTAKTKPTTATYITKEEVDLLGKSEQGNVSGCFRFISTASTKVTSGFDFRLLM